jgi:hypothetical protein
MPKKQVVEYTCERCTRVWYLDSTAPEPLVKLKLFLDLGKKTDVAPGAAIAYECLCDSCAETVQSLVQSLAPLKPRAPRAKKKDESADQGKPQSTDPTGATPGAIPVVAGDAHSPAAAGVVAAASASQRPSPPNQSRPK